MQQKIARFGAQHLPPTSLLHDLMQFAAFVGLDSADCRFPEAERDHILWPSLSLKL